MVFVSQHIVQCSLPAIFHCSYVFNSILFVCSVGESLRGKLKDRLVKEFVRISSLYLK